MRSWKIEYNHLFAPVIQEILQARTLAKGGVAVKKTDQFYGREEKVIPPRHEKAEQDAQNQA